MKLPSFDWVKFYESFGSLWKVIDYRLLLPFESMFLVGILFAFCNLMKDEYFPSLNLEFLFESLVC